MSPTASSLGGAVLPIFQGWKLRLAELPSPLPKVMKLVWVKLWYSNGSSWILVGTYRFLSPGYSSLEWRECLSHLSVICSTNSSSSHLPDHINSEWKRPWEKQKRQSLAIGSSNLWSRLGIKAHTMWCVHWAWGPGMSFFLSSDNANPWQVCECAVLVFLTL